MKNGHVPKWWQDWTGECVAIIGSGKSAKTAGVEKLRDRIHVIAVNEAFQLAPWADVLYSAEAMWWRTRFLDVDKKFRGLRVTCEINQHTQNCVSIVRIPKGGNDWEWSMQMEFSPGKIGSGGHSGFQMMNLAAQWGATGIALIGFDMNAYHGIHWHGPHKTPLRNPDYDRFAAWRKVTDEAAPVLASRGVDVVNCSDISVLTAYPKMTVDQMLQRWGL